jgi:signal transduction histidine kinase/CheY-like chemotaxis protein
VTTSNTSDTSAAQLAQSTERLLGCSVSALPTPSLARQGPDERIESLLEWMVGVARGASGAVLLVGDAGRLGVRAVVGISPEPDCALPDDPSSLAFGLIVHGAEIDGDGRDGHDETATACEHGLVDTESRMAVCLPLEVEGRLLGGVQIGFASLRTLDPAEIRRLSMIADHIASAAEAARLTRESRARLTEIERVSHALHEVERMKNDFLSMISHELRTPLTAIIGYTDLLLRQIHGPLNDRQGHHQGAVKKAAHRLLALINDLLDLNRLEGGHVELNLDSVSAVDAVKLAVSRAAESAERQGVELRLDVPLTSVSIQADPERFHQILVNLLDNAIKFTPDGGSVTVRLTQRDGLLTVSVIDTGVGVPPGQVDRIWDRFHQVDSSTRRQFGGTGLGLAIVRHLVELHGGTVAVTSAGPGQGSTFSFTIPLAASTSRQPDPPPARDGTSTPPRSACTVLIVDDEPDNREVVSSIVQDVMGHAAVTAENGAEALTAARAQPDLVLLDLRMPGLSGFDVARALKRDALTEGIPIIAITALDAEDDRRVALAAGCVG